MYILQRTTRTSIHARKKHISSQIPGVYDAILLTSVSHGLVHVMEMVLGAASADGAGSVTPPFQICRHEKDEKIEFKLLEKASVWVGSP